MDPVRPPLPVAFPGSVTLLSRTPIQDEPLTVSEGDLPPDLHGHAFFIGPGGSLNNRNLPESDLIQPNQDGTPLFNGDPLIYRIDFSAETARLTSRIPHTPCYYTDLACETDPAYGDMRYRNHGMARLSFQLGFRNEINTALIPVRFTPEEGIRMLITWDAGRPYEIDPVSLEIKTPIGFNHEWQEQIPLPLPFPIVTTTAHPAFDHTPDPVSQRAQLYTLNYGKSIGTAMHPILSGDAGAPFTHSDEEVEQEVRELITTMKRLLGWLSGPLGVLLKVDIDIVQKLLGWLLRRVMTVAGWFWPRIDKLVPERGNRVRRLHLQRDVVDEVLKLTREKLPQGTRTTQDHLLEWKRLLAVAEMLLNSASEMNDFVHILAWDGSSELHRWNMLVRDGEELVKPRIFQSMHQMAITSNHLILMDTVFKLGAEQLLTAPTPDFPSLDALIRRLLDFKQSDDAVIYIIDREQLTRAQDQVVARRLVIPFSAAHFLADYEEHDGRITLHMGHNTGWDPAEWTRSFDDFPYSPLQPSTLGMATSGSDINMLGHYEVDTRTGTITRSEQYKHNDLTWMVAIYAYGMPDGVTPVPRIGSLYWNCWGARGELLPQYTEDLYGGPNYTTRNLPRQEVERIAAESRPGTLCHLDTQRMIIDDHYVFPPGCFGTSAQFVPRRDGEGDQRNGYLICIVNDSDDPSRSAFWLFDAARLAAGPVCKLSHPSLAIGLTIHSTWIPTLKAGAASSYNVPVQDDYNARLQMIDNGEQRKRLEQLFQTHVYPHFPNT